MPSVSAVWREIQGRLEAARQVAPSEGKQLVKHVLGLDDVGMVLQGDSPFPLDKKEILENLVVRRAAGEPLAHVLGFAWFYGRTWMVTPDVLIPRPDTEVLMEAVLQRITDDNPRVCEVGVGSGCVLGTLLAERPTLRAVGVDVSAAALDVAAKNLRHVCGERAADVRWTLLQNDGLDGVNDMFTHLVSNPPYVTDAEWEHLETEVRDFEPRLALTGGVPNEDGLVFYRRLADWGSTKLQAQGWLCMEVGWQQAQAVRKLLEEQNNAAKGALWQDISVTKDLGGRERVVCAQRC